MKNGTFVKNEIAVNRRNVVGVGAGDGKKEKTQWDLALFMPPPTEQNHDAL